MTGCNGLPDFPRFADDRIWTGGGCMGLGMVFLGASMGDNVRTPEDDQKLKKLEQKLVELKFVTAPKLQVLCSSTCRPHLEEPFHMNVKTPPGPFGGGEIFRLAKYWREEHKRRRQGELEARQREKEEMRWVRSLVIGMFPDAFVTAR